MKVCGISNKSLVELDTQLQLSFSRGMRVVEVVVSGFFDTIGLYDEWGDTQRQCCPTVAMRALGMADYLHGKILTRCHLACNAWCYSPEPW